MRDVGWGNPDPLSAKAKFHFYGTDGRSLCGRYGRFAGLPTVEDAHDDHSANCKACKSKVLKYKASDIYKNRQVATLAK